MCPRRCCADGVVEEIGDEPFDEARVAGRVRRSNRCLEGEARVVCCGRGGGRDGGEVDGLVVVEAALAAGEREQRFDQTFLLLADGEQLLAGVPVGLDAGVGIAEGELEQGALEGERGAQLVGGVGDELSLRLEGVSRRPSSPSTVVPSCLSSSSGLRGRAGGGGCWPRCRGRCR
jgi:hypothetical protein